MEHNSGQAAVRTWGMLNASGDYVIHCDSDDWVDKNLYKTLYTTAVQNQADVVVCDYVVHDGVNSLRQVRGCSTLDRLSFVNNLLLKKDPWALWNKLFRRELCQNNLCFPTGNMGEDMALCIQMLLRCNTISCVSGVFYYYYFNSSSIMNQMSKDKNLYNYESLRNNNIIVERAIEAEGLQDKFKQGIKNIQFNSLVWLFPYVNKYHVYCLLNNTYSTGPIAYLKTPSVSFEYKIQYLLALVRIFPYLMRLKKWLS